MRVYKVLSRLKKNLLLIPVFLSLGCANLGPMLSESNVTYHFRKAYLCQRVHFSGQCQQFRI